MTVPDPLIVVCGARRTGTTLLAAILSAAETAPPLPGEAQLLWKWLESYRWAREHFAIRALPFFDDEDSLRDFHRHLLSEFVRHCVDHFDPATALVLKSPELSLFIEEAYELLPDAQFVVSVRDPRDQVASEWSVIERRSGSERDRRIVGDRDFRTLAHQYNAYYAPLLRVIKSRPERVMVQRFEDLLTDNAAAVSRLAAFTGLDLSLYDPDQAWPRVADSYWAYGTSPSDTPFYGAELERNRVGTHVDVMSPAESRIVRDECFAVAERLGYGSDMSSP